MKRGMGADQINKAELSTQKILEILQDGKWHRYMELLNKTKISPTTLTKRLKDLEKGIVEREIDIKSTEYPPPVRYRLREAFFPKIPHRPKEKSCYFTLKMNNMVLDILFLNHLAGVTLLQFLELYSKNPDLKEEMFDQAVEHYLVSRLKEDIQNLKGIVKEYYLKGYDLSKLFVGSIDNLNEDYKLAQKNELKRKEGH